MTKIDEEEIVAGVRRAVRYLNANPGVSRTTCAFGGDTIAESSTFVLIARAGTSTGELLRAVVQDEFREATNYRASTDGEVKFHEVSDVPGTLGDPLDDHARLDLLERRLIILRREVRWASLSALVAGALAGLVLGAL